MIEQLLTVAELMGKGLLYWMAFGTLIYLALMAVSACVGRRRTRRHVDAFNNWMDAR